MYRIDMWRYRCIEETFENKDIKEVLNWYKENWQHSYENGGCAFHVYENDIEIDFDKKVELRFYE